MVSISGSASKVPIAPSREKLNTRLSYVYSERFVKSGSTSSKSSGDGE
jgi:hypothetical protein